MASAHVLASSLVTAATRRGLALEMPDVHEEHGYGLRGQVGGHEVRLGKAGRFDGPARQTWPDTPVWWLNLQAR